VEYKVTLTFPARQDMREIRAYIARDNPEAAIKFCRELLLQAASLKTFPLRQRKVSGSAHDHVLPYQAYLIFYEIDAESLRVNILRFWHGAQNPRGLRLKEEAAGYGQALIASPVTAMA
jgi:plasmid stabilization system protein ParE